VKLLTFLFIAFGFVFSTNAQNKNTLAQCNEFKKLAAQDPKIITGTFQVPFSYQSEKGKKISIFYWLRKGINPNKPPVLLIHGGPGGNSWRYYSTFKNVPYTGDIIAIDNRNEGCSHVMDYKFQPEQYENFRSRWIVRDLETLRTLLYGAQSQWRIFGQSRGVTIAHHYLEMFPQSLESVQTHGFALATPQTMINYTYYRSLFNARGSSRFFQKFPHVQSVYLKAQDYFKKNKICLPINLGQQDLPIPQRPLVCGSLITDAISYKLSNYTRWPDIAASLATLQNPDGSLNPQKATTLFQAELNGNIYVGHMNYIMGTNGRDVASPSPQTFKAVTTNPEIMNALISEGRFVALAVYPAYLASGGKPFKASVDMINFEQVRKNLHAYEVKNKRKLPFILFSSLYDTIAGPELYFEEVKNLFPFVQLFPLSNSGHEGWDTEPKVREIIFR
jgi:pimeloyl-ACP methyl ester carboxylesterase